MPIQLPDEEEEDGKGQGRESQRERSEQGMPAAQGAQGALRPAFMNQYFNRDA